MSKKGRDRRLDKILYGLDGLDLFNALPRFVFGPTGCIDFAACFVGKRDELVAFNEVAA